MTDKFERTALSKARSGKASKAWLKSAAQTPRTVLATQALDAAFPGWIPGRGLDPGAVSLVDDILLAHDLSSDRPLEPRLQAALDSWVQQGIDGTLPEVLWRHLDGVLPQWLGKQGGKRVAALRLRSVQLAGFRVAAGQDPHTSAQDKHERSLAGWLQRNRLKMRKGLLPSRDEAIILGRIGSWTM